MSCSVTERVPENAGGGAVGGGTVGGGVGGGGTGVGAVTATSCRLRGGTTTNTTVRQSPGGGGGGGGGDGGRDGGGGGKQRGGGGGGGGGAATNATSNGGGGGASNGNNGQGPPTGRSKPCLCWCCCCRCNWCRSLFSSAPGGKGSEDNNGPSKNSNSSDAHCEEEAQISIEDIRSWGRSFDKLMRSADGRKIFREFLKCEYSEENILFWMACEELKNETNAEGVEEKARCIYEDYISILSPKEVSLDSRVREVVNRNMVDPTPNTFDEAQLQIYTLMHRDSYPRFINSAMYKQMAAITQPEQDGAAAAAAATAAAAAAVVVTTHQQPAGGSESSGGAGADTTSTG